MKIYLDSCIPIYLLDGPEPFFQAAAGAMRATRNALFCFSDLVRLECLVGPIRCGDEEQRKVFEAQFQRMTYLPLTPFVFDLAAELRARHRFKTPDAIHAAAAIAHACDEFWTNDRRLAAIESRITLRVIPEPGP